MARYTLCFVLILWLATANCFPSSETEYPNEEDNGTKRKDVKVEGSQVQYLHRLRNSEKNTTVGQEEAEEQATEKEFFYKTSQTTENSKTQIEQKEKSKEDDSSLIEYDLSEPREDSTATARPFDLVTNPPPTRRLHVSVSDEDPENSFDEEEILNSKKVSVTVPAPINVIKENSFPYSSYLLNNNAKKTTNQFDFMAKENKTDSRHDIILISSFKLNDENKNPILENKNPSSISDLITKDPKLNNSHEIAKNSSSTLSHTNDKNEIDETRTSELDSTVGYKHDIENTKFTTSNNEFKKTSHETELNSKPNGDHTNTFEFMTHKSKVSDAFENFSDEISSQSNEDKDIDSGEFDSRDYKKNNNFMNTDLKRSEQSENPYKTDIDSYEHKYYTGIKKDSFTRKKWYGKKDQYRRNDSKVGHHKRYYPKNSWNEFENRKHRKSHHYTNKASRRWHNDKAGRSHKHSKWHKDSKKSYSKNNSFHRKDNFSTERHDIKYSHQNNHKHKNDKRWKEFSHDRQNYIDNDYQNNKWHRSHKHHRTTYKNTGDRYEDCHRDGTHTYGK